MKENTSNDFFYKVIVRNSSNYSLYRILIKFWPENDVIAKDENTYYNLGAGSSDVFEIRTTSIEEYRRHIWSIYWEIKDEDKDYWGCKQLVWNITEKDIENPGQIEILVLDNKEEKRFTLIAPSGAKVIKAKKVKN